MVSVTSSGVAGGDSQSTNTVLPSFRRVIPMLISLITDNFGSGGSAQLNITFNIRTCVCVVVVVVVVVALAAAFIRGVLKGSRSEKGGSFERG